MRSHIGWGGERSVLYKGVETSLQLTCFKNFEGKLERENSKRTIFARGGFGLLQMILEPDSEQCVNEEAEPRRGDGHEAVRQQGCWAP